MDLVVHGRDGVIRTGAEGRGPAAGIGGGEDHGYDGINIRVVRKRVRELGEEVRVLVEYERGQYNGLYKCADPGLNKWG